MCTSTLTLTLLSTPLKKFWRDFEQFTQMNMGKVRFKGCTRVYLFCNHLGYIVWQFTYEHLTNIPWWLQSGRYMVMHLLWYVKQFVMFYSCCIRPWNLQSRTYPSHICHHCMCKYFSKMAMFPVVELMWVTALSLLANFTKFPICACTALVAYMYSPSLPLTWQVLAMHVCKSRQKNGWNPLFALRTVRLVKSCQQYSWPLANKNNLICKCTDLAKLQDFPNKIADMTCDTPPR